MLNSKAQRVMSLSWGCPLLKPVMKHSISGAEIHPVSRATCVTPDGVHGLYIYSVVGLISNFSYCCCLWCFGQLAWARKEANVISAGGQLQKDGFVWLKEKKREHPCSHCPRVPVTLVICKILANDRTCLLRCMNVIGLVNWFVFAAPS